MLLLSKSLLAIASCASCFIVWGSYLVPSSWFTLPLYVDIVLKMIDCLFFCLSLEYNFGCNLQRLVHLNEKVLSKSIR